MTEQTEPEKKYNNELVGTHEGGDIKSVLVRLLNIPKNEQPVVRIGWSGLDSGDKMMSSVISIYPQQSFCLFNGSKVRISGKLLVDGHTQDFYWSAPGEEISEKEKSARIKSIKVYRVKTDKEQWAGEENTEKKKDECKQKLAVEYHTLLDSDIRCLQENVDYLHEPWRRIILPKDWELDEPDAQKYGIQEIKIENRKHSGGHTYRYLHVIDTNGKVFSLNYGIGTSELEEAEKNKKKELFEQSKDKRPGISQEIIKQITTDPKLSLQARQLMKEIVARRHFGPWTKILDKSASLPYQITEITEYTKPTPDVPFAIYIADNQGNHWLYDQKNLKLPSHEYVLKKFVSNNSELSTRAKRKLTSIIRSRQNGPWATDNDSARIDVVAENHDAHEIHFMDENGNILGEPIPLPEIKNPPPKAKKKKHAETGDKKMTAEEQERANDFINSWGFDLSSDGRAFLTKKIESGEWGPWAYDNENIEANDDDMGMITIVTDGERFNYYYQEKAEKIAKKHFTYFWNTFVVNNHQLTPEMKVAIKKMESFDSGVVDGPWLQLPGYVKEVFQEEQELIISSKYDDHWRYYLNDDGKLVNQSKSW